MWWLSGTSGGHPSCYSYKVVENTGASGGQQGTIVGHLGTEEWLRRAGVWPRAQAFGPVGLRQREGPEALKPGWGRCHGFPQLLSFSKLHLIRTETLVLRQEL